MGEADLGVFGVGVMGSALARNARRQGYDVAIYDHYAPLTERLMETHGEADGRRFRAAYEVETFVNSLATPRRILLMVKAGDPVDQVLATLAPHLAEGDVVVDGGNSHPRDTERRVKWSAEHGFLFMGMGVSGGEAGALNGPAMMPGGAPEAFETIRPLFESMAARSEHGPCIGWCGQGGAGHHVKMVHNGIEYAEMQALAEVVTVMREGMGRTAPQVRQALETWNQGRMASYLVEITAGLVAAKDPQGDGPLLDHVLDVAGQKGTGRWTAVDAVTEGVATPGITAAVDGRVLSSMKSLRQRLGDTVGRSLVEPSAFDALTEADLESALYVVRIANYAQGCSLIAALSKRYGYETKLGEVARIWTAGCIIRAALLEDVMGAYRRSESLGNLMEDEALFADVLSALPGLRKAVAAAALGGLPVPVLSAALAYVDSLVRPRGSANVIQAQRDWFGAHTYRRVEAPDIAVHTQWDELPQLS